MSYRTPRDDMDRRKFFGRGGSLIVNKIDLAYVVVLIQLVVTQQ